ncbi:MAG TPA: alpha/beta hydrolase, partial [Chitinophagaceae bacterium]|nr:alpha/beta hydrolase [Chitinophagaceae bacterium]
TMLSVVCNYGSTSYFRNSMNFKTAFLGILLLLSISLHGQEPIANKYISEERFIPINGIDQWLTIKGDTSKPVILFLHGGPGSPLSPYADNIYSGWEKDFTLVQWDQRGAGKTYGRTAPEELSPEYLQTNPLTVEQMTADGIALAEYLVKHLGKQKMILFGTSWGSIIGVNMAVQRPDLFHAYFGHSQVVNPSEGLIDAYEKVLQMAQSAGDTISTNVLNTIGPPPYDMAKNAGQLLRIIKKYERAYATAAPEQWFTLSAGYDSEKDEQHRSDGDDYSFVNYVGDKRLDIKSMAAGIDLLENQWNFKIPVYLIQGEEDILTPKENTREYFDKITAPKKEFILLTKTAHGFNQAVIEMQYKIMKGLPIID